MEKRIEKIKEFIEQNNPPTLQDLENFRIALLGKKGEITQLFNHLKELSGDEKKAFGAHINRVKVEAIEKVRKFKESIESSLSRISSEDTTKPAYPTGIGSRHLINVVQEEMYEIFGSLGYKILEGPEIEDDWHVFSALNFPEEHPARDMQDTFFIQNRPEILLRTHTSSVQVRTMEAQKPPIRVICPGRVFRNEAISARSHCFFHQVEGLYIDKDVSFVDLKQSLLYFAKQFFGHDAKIRLRPSYFPFTEPSAEMDVSCNLCGGEGCTVCKYSGWLEILGCGMVDPQVLESNGIDSSVYSGFAFGMGIERMAMLKYGVKDLRIFSENDVRFLNQFKSVL